MLNFLPVSRQQLTWFKALSLVFVTLLARALLDKALAWQAEPVLVALWAQYQSIVDLVAGIALVGLGQGLTVFAARNEHAFGPLLRAGLVWGLTISGLLGLLILLLLPLLGLAQRADALLQPAGVIVAVLGGWVSVAPGLFLAWWQGRRQRGRMVLILLLSWLPLLLVASGLFGAPDLRRLLTVQLVTQCGLVVVLLATHWQPFRGGGSWRASPLPRYLLAGLSIGVLSPLSLLWLRAELAAQLSWLDVAQLQALWRVSEWVTGIAANILFLLWLPRLAQQREAPAFAREMGRIWRVVFVPALGALALVMLLRVPLLLLFYDARFVMPWQASVVFLLGDCVRVAAWVPLLGLFARERVGAIALGEWLSLPLFAVSVTLVRPSGLLGTAVLYLMSYLLYFTFNRLALSRCVSGTMSALRH